MHTLTDAVQALSVALLEHPEMNSSLAENGASLLMHKSHNIGVAMATPHGLVVNPLHPACLLPRLAPERFAPQRMAYCIQALIYTSQLHSGCSNAIRWAAALAAEFAAGRHWCSS